MGELLGSRDLLLRALSPGKGAMTNSSPASRSITCVWFKRDLRVLDHAPLLAAAKRGRVLPVYIIEPEVIGAPDFDAMPWQFIAESLAELQQALAERGIALQIIHGEAAAVFARLYQKHRFDAIVAHEETGNAITYARDLRVGAWAASSGIDFQEFPQNGVVRRLADRDGWARHWEQRISAPIIPAPETLAAPDELAPSIIPSAGTLGLCASPRALDLTGGEMQAHLLLESFTKGRGARYQREMSSPVTAYQSCSRLSAYLTWGCISMRTVVQFVRAAAGQTLPKIAARAFLSRCHWHCHFMQKLESEPALEFHAFNRVCEDLREDGNDPAHLAAWQAGRTGYPFIDACIRALKARGWINFRMRAMLVSFASYHLWLDWRSFKDWLACQFIDYEPGIHISQIQMQSGLTGINTLRIYNPVKQGKDHDPSGAFIRHWVPELAPLSDGDIHEPWKLPELLQIECGVRIGIDYPQPIVDHTTAIRHARAAFTALRKRDDYWESARAVMKRHGSRKSRESKNRPQRPKDKAESDQTELSLGD
jgi:deoxyribodipyrimidine photo-lyase